MPQQGITPGAWVLDERAQRKTAVKAGLNSKGPAMQVRTLIIHDGKAQEWNPAVFDSLIVGTWKETLDTNLNKALDLGQAMWEHGKGEEETGRTYEHISLVTGRNKTVVTGRNMGPISNLFAGFRVSSTALQNNATLGRMADSISETHGIIFESIEYIKTVYQQKNDGSFIPVRSAPETGLLADKPFDNGSHKQAFEFRHNDIELVAKKHFHFDKKVWSLATMTTYVNQKLLEMECKKAILLASYLEAFNEKLKDTYEELDLPTLIYTPCFLIKITSGLNKDEAFMVEPDLRSTGDCIKINNTDEFSPPDEVEVEFQHQRLYRFMYAFTHFVFHRSINGAKTAEAREAAMVVIADIQGKFRCD
ncbi:hypothetical protein TREMEDRAFT_59717 [Tremella mesenterica DSM 1558]|uniref:uncharacterized protein n=1 Tax=Tremella mesenterica (strain ATCC 24925 / CBS 8224 / DSM 1558 / NBRC 9311 / NRRL Y-6157 / RJB 2259-6 / UBC 559-6) TaxID=578456 RepID=UPI0003F494FE|nr:uncharacterized protein TREMEDRAFT_59717 [Tremella mesenterica DSM 1558]EIW73541.1 hypothetical protein TREMEDRAFT_59717 [Tremella mesenterica DSM 1558]